MHRIAQRWRRRTWFAVLLLVALVSRALVPMGFMPGHGGLMLCPAYASVPAVSAGPSASATPDAAMSDMDMGGNGHPAGGRPHPPNDESNAVCPFAYSASSMVPLPAVPAAALPVLQPTTGTLYVPEKTVPRGTIMPTRLPRGPPFLT